MFFGEVSPKNFSKTPTKSAAFVSESVSENPAKFDVFFPQPIRSPAKSERKMSN